jgi:hypothetical protein
MTDLLHRQAPEVKPKRSKWLMFSIGFMALVVILVVYVLWPTSPAPPTATSAPVPSVVVDPRPAADGSCNLPPPASQDVLPADVTWVLAGPTAHPTSATAGPAVIAGGVASCFARTPGGALLSAANFMSSLADPASDKPALYDQRLVHSTGFDALVATVADAQGASLQQKDSIWQITAFRFLTYDPDHAVLYLASRNTLNQGATNGTLVATTYVLKWDAGDWKIVPPLDGGNLPSLQVPYLSDLYTHFGGA